jgi:triacylglycerol lipase
MIKHNITAVYPVSKLPDSSRISRLWKLCLLLLLLSPVSAIADIAVLIHGYHSNALAWERSGVVPILEDNGWTRAGLYTATARGISFSPATASRAINRTYIIDLPSEAPVRVQSGLLSAALMDIRRRHAGEPITLIGHSAGAIVGRSVLVQGNIAGVERLISIAGPNLGTERTVQALNATDIPWPFSYVADFFAVDSYDTIKRSRHLLVDLLPATPGTYLGWLNVQPHPEIDYIAVVRGHNLVMSGDWMVPGMSQDLNNVIALAGRARVLTVPAEHELSPLDGAVLVSILNETGDDSE